MALQLFVSNSLKALSQHLSQSLAHSRRGVFQPDVIVTQTDGMSNWLTLEIAEKTGIAANIEWLKPGELVQQLYWLLGGRHEQMIARQSLDWLIYKVLGSDGFQQKFKDKAAYYNQDAATKEIRQMSLAGKLADLFDQYQIYRTEIIHDWNTKAWQEAEPKFMWQAYIWQSVKNEAGQSVPDMTDVRTFILEELKNKDTVEHLRKRLPNVYLFGLSIITQFHIRIFYEVAKHINLHFYLQNPAPDVFWMEDKSEKEILKLKIKNKTGKVWEATEGNSLLANWGKVLQNTFGMLYQTEDFINNQIDVDVAEPQPNTLLAKIQNDIFNNNTEKIIFTPTDLNDESIIINSCYTRAREVEVLYNYLVSLFHHKKIKEANARDILVMVNNIDDYAPYIRAIFKNAPVKFPFNIADESFVHGDTPVSSLVALLEINESSLTAENVLQLLESANIRNHFGITDIEHIRKSVNLANIRFGIDNDIADDSYLVSWNNGLRRMMFGLCLSGSSEFQFGNAPSFYCLDNTEGIENTQQIIRFADFVTQLIDHIRNRKEPKTLEQWAAFVMNTIDSFIDTTNEDDERYLAVINRHLKNYEEVAPLVETTFNYEIFSSHITATLQHEQQTKLFSSGGITFCSFIPMRSIPFKVIAILGLGFNDFPRKEIKPDFDLIQQQRRIGDRNIKDNDKHLFLETILSAQEKLYLSFTGRSAKDNSHLPPSILLDELLDYIQNGINNNSKNQRSEKIDVRKKLITQQLLHNFSSRYNKEDVRLYNYLLTEQKEQLSFRKQNAEEKPVVIEALTVKDLQLFCRNSIQFYYQKVLNLYFTQEALAIPETEVFQLDRLEALSLSTHLLNTIIYKENTNAFIEKELKQGHLPLKNAGKQAMLSTLQNVNQTAQQIQNLVGDVAAEKKYIDLFINNIHIKGSVDLVFKDTLLHIGKSSVTEKNIIEPYINLLLGTASGTFNKAFIITKNDILQSHTISLNEATKRLAVLIKMLLQSYQNMAVFSIDFLPEKKQLQEMNDAYLFKKIHDGIGNYQQYIHNQYIIDAAQKGLFNKPGIAESFKAMYTHLFLAATEIFNASE